MIALQIQMNTSVSNVLQYTLPNFEWLPIDPVKHVKYLGLECLQTHFIKFRRFYMKQNVWYNQSPWILTISTVNCIGAYTVLKVGYKNDVLIFEIFLRRSKMCGRTKLLGFKKSQQ